MTGILAPSRRLPPARRLGTPPTNATIAERLDLSPTMARFRIAPDDGVPAFAPGQYFALGLEVGDRFVQRPYSAGSSSTDPAIELAIRLVPDGALTPALWRSRPGDRLRLGPPRGLFRLADDDPRRHLMIGTGTGIAPLLAMARALRGRPAPPPTTILHGAARTDELAFMAELAVIAGQTPGWAYLPAISRPTDPGNLGWAGHRGRVDTLLPRLFEKGEPASGSVAFLCGSPAMVEDLALALAELGLPRRDIHAEAF